MDKQLSHQREKRKNQFLTNYCNNIDDEVRRHLMVLLLTVPQKEPDAIDAVNSKRNALRRLEGCVSLPDDFDYKTSIAEALESKYL